MIVAVLPLIEISISAELFNSWSPEREVWGGQTYKAANPRILATKTLVCRFICNFRTMKNGSTPKVQSATLLSTEMM